MISEAATLSLLDDRHINGSEVEPCRTATEILADYGAIKKETDNEIIARLYRHIPLATYTPEDAFAKRDDMSGASRLAVAREAEMPLIIERDAIVNEHCEPLTTQLLGGKGDFYYASNRVIAAVESTNTATRSGIASIVRKCLDSCRVHFTEDVKVEMLVHQSKLKLEPKKTPVQKGSLGVFLTEKNTIQTTGLTTRSSAAVAAAAVITNTASRNQHKSAFDVVQSTITQPTPTAFHGVSKFRRRLSMDASGRACEKTISVDDSTDEEGEVPTKCYSTKAVGGLFPATTSPDMPILGQVLPMRVVGSAKDIAVQLEHLQSYFTDANCELRMTALVEETVQAIYDGMIKSNVIIGAQNAFRVEQAEEQMDILRKQLDARELLAAQQRKEISGALSNAQESVRQVTAKYDELRAAFKELQTNLGSGPKAMNQPSLSRSKSIFHVEKEDATYRPSKPRNSGVRSRGRLSAGLLEESPSMNSTYDADMSPLLDVTHGTMLVSRSGPVAGSPTESVASGVYRPRAENEVGEASVGGTSSVSPPSRTMEGVVMSNVTAPRIHWSFDGRFIPAVVLPPPTSIDTLQAKHEEEWAARKLAEVADSTRSRKQSEAEKRLKVLQASVSQHQAVASQRARQVHEQHLISVKAQYEGRIAELNQRISDIQKEHASTLEKQALKHLRDLTKQQQRSADRQSRWKIQLSRSVEEKCMEICDRDAQYDVCIVDILKQQDMMKEAHSAELVRSQWDHSVAMDAQTKLYRQLQARYNAVKVQDSTLNVKHVQSRRSSAVSPVPSGLSDVVQVEVPSDSDSASSRAVTVEGEDIVFTPSKSRKRRGKASGEVRPTLSRGRTASALPRRQSVMRRTTSVIPLNARERTTSVISATTSFDVTQRSESSMSCALPLASHSTQTETRPRNSEMQFVCGVSLWEEMTAALLAFRGDLLMFGHTGKQIPLKQKLTGSSRRSTLIDDVAGLSAAKSQAFFASLTDDSNEENVPNNLDLSKSSEVKQVKSTRPVSATTRNKSVFAPTRPVTAKIRSSGYVAPAAPPPRVKTAVTTRTAEFSVARRASRGDQRKQEYLEEQRLRWERVLWTSPERDREV